MEQEAKRVEDYRGELIVFQYKKSDWDEAYHTGYGLVDVSLINLLYSYKEFHFMPLKGFDFELSLLEAGKWNLWKAMVFDGESGSSLVIVTRSGYVHLYSTSSALEAMKVFWDSYPDYGEPIWELVDYKGNKDKGKNFKGLSSLS